jgi:hypothetical protein
MKSNIALFLIMLFALLLTQSKHDLQPGPLLLAHVTVIDITGGSTKLDMSVVITGDRISDIGEANKVSVPSDAKVVNAAGKVYSLLPRDAYFGIADEALQQGLTFVGHVPLSVSPSEASEAGQKSIEHLTGIIIECSDQEVELRKEIVQANSPAARACAQAMALDTYNNGKAAALFERFVKNETWQCPTLTVSRSTAYLGDSKNQCGTIEWTAL